MSKQVYCRDRVRNLANKSVHLVAQVHLVSQVSIQFYILHKLYILVIVPHHFSHHEQIFKFFQICSPKSVLPAPQVCSAHWLLVCKLSGVKCLILPSKGEYSSSNTHFTVFFWEAKQNKQTNAPFSPVALNLTSLWSTLRETAAKLSLKLYSP